MNTFIKLDLTFYYWTEDGTVNYMSKEYDVKKGWSVLIDGDLIFDPGILRHFEEYLDQQGWEGCNPGFPHGPIVDVLPEI